MQREVRRVTKSDREDGESKRRVKYASYTRQIMCSLVLSCGLFHSAFIIGSTSALPEILNKGNPGANYTNVDLKWLASGGVIIGIPGNFISYHICTLIGPRLMFRWIQPVSSIFYLMMALFPTFETVLFSRLGIGMVMGICDLIIFSLIAEITEPDLRGFASALPDIIISIAILWVYAAFTFLEEKMAILCIIIPILLGFLGSFAVPESPIWLIKKGRWNEALRSAHRIAGPSREEVVESFLPSSAVHQQGQENTLKEQVLLLRKKQNWKPISQAVMVFLFKELGGNTALLHYAGFIFQRANPALDAFVCTVLLGAIRLLGSVSSCVFHDRVGRRPMLIGTFFIAGVSSFIGGLFLYGEFNTSTWVSIVALLIFVAMNGIGTGPIPWMLIGELVPPAVRLLGSSIIISMFYVLQFSVVTAVPLLVHSISLGPSLMAFGLIDVLGSIIIWIFLPETKKKSLMQIEEHYNRNFAEKKDCVLFPSEISLKEISNNSI